MTIESDAPTSDEQLGGSASTDLLERAPVPLVRRPWFKRLIMIAVVLAVAGLGKVLGVWDAVSVDTIQAWTARAGWLAVPLFLVAFVGSNSLAVPGILFVLGGLLAFGPIMGVPVVVLGSACAGTFATWWMEKVGGTSQGPPASPIARRIQARLHDRPIMAVAMLRLVTRLAPPAHMLLALAGVSPIQNFVGTLVGFTPRVILIAVFFEPVLEWVLAK